VQWLTTGGGIEQSTRCNRTCRRGRLWVPPYAGTVEQAIGHQRLSFAFELGLKGIGWCSSAAGFTS
jgi:hypothetical protein